MQPLIYLSTWTTIQVGTPPVSSPIPLLQTAYPNGAFTQSTNVSSPARIALAVYDAPTQQALATDYRFPQVPSAAFQFADYQSAMLAACDTYQAAELSQGFAYNGVTYPLDTDSRQDWHVVLTLGPALSWPKLVTSLDGLTVVSMDQATATSAAQAALASAATIIQTAATYRQAILAATTPADLDAIVLT